MPNSSQAFLREPDKKLWTAADRLRSNLDAAVYKHAVLGLIFLKYVSDSFVQRQAEIEAMLRDPESDLFMAPVDHGGEGRYEEAIRQELEERDYYIEKNVFWVPALARWKTLQDSAKLPPGTEIKERGRLAHSYKFTSLGKLIDDALEAVEKENPNGAERHRLSRRAARRVRAGARINRKNVLNKNHTQLQIDPANLAGLIDLIATIPFQHADRNLPQQSAAATGAKEILGPDPESSRSTSSSAPLGDLCAFAVQNSSMAIRRLDFDFGKEPADTFARDQHPVLRADFVMANAPFNDWGSQNRQHSLPSAPCAKI